MNYDNLKAIFNLGRPITEDSKFSYIHYAYKYQPDNYRLITSGELFVRGRNLQIPQYLVQFMSYHGEAVMMANIISNKVINIVFRSINTNAPFVADKIIDYKKEIWNEALTFLGINNLGWHSFSFCQSEAAEGGWNEGDDEGEKEGAGLDRICGRSSELGRREGCG